MDFTDCRSSSFLCCQVRCCTWAGISCSPLPTRSDAGFCCR